MGVEVKRGGNGKEGRGGGAQRGGGEAKGKEGEMRGERYNRAGTLRTL